MDFKTLVNMLLLLGEMGEIPLECERVEECDCPEERISETAGSVGCI